jgi:hypothetical protein
MPYMYIKSRRILLSELEKRGSIRRDYGAVSPQPVEHFSRKSGLALELHLISIHVAVRRERVHAPGCIDNTVRASMHYTHARRHLQ